MKNREVIFEKRLYKEDFVWPMRETMGPRPICATVVAFVSRNDDGTLDVDIRKVYSESSLLTGEVNMTCFRDLEALARKAYDDDRLADLKGDSAWEGEEPEAS